ncbi:hypothetical protein BH09ACT12_BH09ACT12_07010 [soil metagenome]
MCFSETADLAVGAALLPVGVVSLAMVRRAREVPFAALPLLFSAHHLVEALVWHGGGSGSGASHAAAVVYVLYAMVVLPTLVPLAVQLIEPPGRVRRIVPFTVLGLMVTAYFGWTVASNGVAVREEPHALIYDIGLRYGMFATTLYVVAVTGSAIVSGFRSLVAFGVANLVGLTIVAVAYQQAFASLWCVWAAVTSVLVVWHMWTRRRPDVPAQ